MAKTKKTAAKSTKAKSSTKGAASKTVASKKTATKTRSPKKKGASKKSTTTKTKTKKSPTVVMDRRTKSERRTTADTQVADANIQDKGDQKEVVKEKVQLERRAKVNRRRQIDPTTCERDYTDQEIEFMHALDAYKHANGRMFPTCSEILEVLRSLGYERRSTEHTTPMSDTPLPATAFGATDEASPESLDDELAWQQTDDEPITV